MSKKFEDLTMGEIAQICQAHTAECRRCPIYGLCEDWFFTAPCYILLKDARKEIETDD